MCPINRIAAHIHVFNVTVTKFLTTLFENRFLFDKNVVNTTSSLHFFLYYEIFLSFPPLKTTQILHLTVI